MKNIKIALIFVLCIILGLVCGKTAFGQTNNVSFPAGFIETWKRDNFNNTLTFTAKTVKASSSATTWNITAINGNTYKMNNGKTDMTLTMRLEGGNLVISGDSGQGENNWNGTWKLRPSTIVEGANLTAKLVWVLRNAQSNGDYTIELTGDDSLGAQTLVFEGKTNVTLRFAGGEGEKTISLTGNGSLFTVESGVNLVLGKGVTLCGHNKNNASLVIIRKEASLIMNEGSKITGNTGRGVSVGGTFTMNGGVISGNTDFIDYNNMGGGGGVYASGQFTMNGGEISGNTAVQGGGVYASGQFTMNGGVITSNTSKGIFDRGGGGVFVSESATFIMTGGEINRNTTGNFGGGVYVNNVNETFRKMKGTFTMTNGVIAYNTAVLGGGVYAMGQFTMNGGVISGNTASYIGGGGGVHGSITMNGGVISGNTASYNGGGVSGNISMSGGIISGNSANENGGGVSGNISMSGGIISNNSAGKNGGGVSGSITMSGGEISGNTNGGVYAGRDEYGFNSAFTKNGGTIYGYDAVDGKRNDGYAVLIDDARRRDSTTGPDDNPDPSKTGLAGGWGY